jgi:hypothetical protein
MDIMLEENKNTKSHIKDTSSLLPSYGTEEPHFGSYRKINKLISALYMVTDIMDKEEPLKMELRNLGVKIISDTHFFHKGQDFSKQTINKILVVLSLLEIATSIGAISQMNSNILVNEFIKLRKAILEMNLQKEDTWLKEFIKEDSIPNYGIMANEKSYPSMRHRSTRIGIQKGRNLLKALSHLNGQGNNNIFLSGTQKQNLLNNNINKSENINVLKNKRRQEIVLILKDKIKNFPESNGLTITDIKIHEFGKQGSLASCGEKTLQRELVSMVSDGIIKKTGSKRWSRYSLN